MVLHASGDLRVTQCETLVECLWLHGQWREGTQVFYGMTVFSA